MKRTRKQIVCLLLSVCMVFTMLPTAAFADSTSQITAFADLAGEVAIQEVEFDTALGELNLPSTLNVTVTTGSAITADVSDWVSDPAYNSNTADSYIFTPTLDLSADVTLADGVSLPQIRVTVKPLGAGINITTEFTDANFLAEVREALKKDEDESIYETDDFASVTDLVLNGNSIASLEGIEHFTALKNLNCSNNKLSEIDLASLTQLIFLNCTYNQLTYLDTTGISLDNISGTGQYRIILPMTGSDGNYTASVTFGNGTTFGTTALSYADGTLTSTDNTETSVTFTSPITGTTNQTLKGTLTLNYPTYAVTVNNGTANPSTAKEGATVAITANTPDIDKQFKEWRVISGGVALTDATSATTTFTMPANAVEVTATYEELPTIVPVTGITDVQDTMRVGDSVALSGTVSPANASNQNIFWSIKDAGTTAATITDGTLFATAAGTVAVTATITNGIAYGTDYTQDFTINVAVLTTSATVNPSTYTFDPLEEGYGSYSYLDDAETKTFTITNTGNTELTGLVLSRSNDVTYWSDVDVINDTLAPKASTVFTVKPISDLSAGTYTTTISVSSNGTVLDTVPVRLTVTERVPRLRFGLTDVHGVDTDFSGTGYSWNATTKTLTLTTDYGAGSIELLDFASETATLKLSGDVTIDEQSSNSICIHNSGNLTIDLGGHTLTLKTGGDYNGALEGGKITIKNGTLVTRLQGSDTVNDTSSISARDLTVENATVIANADSLNYGGILASDNLTLKQGAKVYTSGSVGLEVYYVEFNLESDDISLTAIGSTSAVALNADLNYTAGSALKFWTNTDTYQPSPAGEGTLLSPKTRDECSALWGASKYVHIGTESPKSIGNNITANFPDANFLAKVRKALKKVANEPIYDIDDFASIKNLYVSNNNIESLEGIEYFTELTELNCPYNKLTALDVSSNTKLTFLSCSNNQLSALDVSKNTELTNLNCYYNQLTELDVSKNTALTILNCYYNQLTELDVSKNTLLTQLACDYNQLTELDVSINTVLKCLNCSYNYMPGETAVTGLDKDLTTDFTFAPQKSSTSTYAVTVNSGTASSSTAVADATVTITAGSAPSGQRFKEWTVITGGVTLANAQALSTTFNMHTNAVEITATYEDIPAGVTPVTGVTLNKTALSLYSNTSTKTANLTATITPADATDKSVTWQSSNTTVATVDPSGNITAIGNGTATITVATTDGNYTASCTVTVSTYTSGGDSPSGGNSGGSSPSSDSATKATPVTGNQPNLPNLPVTAAAPITAKAGTNGAASASIPDNSIADAITKAQADAKEQGKTTNGVSIALDVTMPKEATALTATLSRNALNSLVSAGVTNLEINGSPVTVSFDQKALTEIQKKSSGNINITIAPQTNLSKTAKKMLGTRPVYNIAVNYGNNSTVSSFGGGVATVAIPYTPAKGEEIGGLYVVYVDEKGNATRVEGSTYDANSGCVIFTTLHFSMYGIGYTAPSAKFTDIGSHWAKESIDYVVGRELLSGTTETTFAPDTAITRSMLATALGRLAEVEVSSDTTSSFTDVKVGSTFQPYMEWAYKKGIIQGISNNQFGPDKAITREEMAVIIENFVKATGYTLSVTREAVTYADALSIGSTYKTAVTAMQQAGILMGGTSNKFNPKSNATRAEVSSMLHRLVKLTIDPDTAQGWAQNDAGQYLYYKEGKALTGTQTIEGEKYFFNSNGDLQTGWVKDSNNLRYYSGNKALVGWHDIGANGSNKTYYFKKDGIMMSGKWLKIDGKWYYFYRDGSLAKSTKIGNYKVDENGVRKTK